MVPTESNGAAPGEDGPSPATTVALAAAFSQALAQPAFSSEARPATPDITDHRLYVTEPQNWAAHVKQGTEKTYCFQKNPGEEFFHLLLQGEIYLQCGDEKLCLRCAARRGVVTTDRLFWQNRFRRRTHSP